MQTILRTKEEIKEIVSLIRLELYNKGLLCGPKAIRKEMEASGEANLPSRKDNCPDSIKTGVNSPTDW